MNMTELAELAGVSQATVSRVLKNQGGVSPDKVKAVLDVARKHNFVPRVKRPAARKGRISIGMLLTAPVHHLAPELLLRTQQSIVENLPDGAGLIFLSYVSDNARVAEIIREQEISGLLLAGHLMPDRLAETISGIPHAWLNSHHENKQHMALGGNELAGALAARTFAEAGCRRLVVLDYPGCNPGLKMRINGFRFEALSRNIGLEVIAVEGENFEDSSSQEIFANLDMVLPAIDLKGCGLFIPDDRLTTIAYPVLQRLPLTLGKDLRLISCNNQREILSGLQPRPSTIDLAPEITAKLALTELLNRINGKPQSERVDIVIKPELVGGETC